jgi:flagellar basal body-associated protein FliL
MIFKKADGLSLSTVVIATLVLLVLVVLTVIFSTRMGIFSSGLRHCDTLCTTSTEDCNNQGYSLVAYYGSCKDILGNEITENAYCCKGQRQQI